MGDSRIDGNHQIQFGDRRRSIRQIGKMRTQIDDRRYIQQRAIGIGNLFLQAVKTYSRNVQKWQKLTQIARTLHILAVFGIPRPDNPDFQIAIGQKRKFCICRRGQISSLSRYCFQLCTENIGQTQHRHLYVKFRNLLASNY